MVRAASIITRLARYGRTFLPSTLFSGVPRQREATLYSASRMVRTLLRTKRAMPIQPVAHKATMMVQKPGLMI